MQKLTNYQKKVFTLVESLKWNLCTDYEGEFNDRNAQTILSLFMQSYQEENPILRLELYEKLKSKIADQNELRIIDWFEKERGIKYSGEILPFSQVKKENCTLPTCSNPDFLQPTRIIGLSKNVPVEEKVTLDPVPMSNSHLMLQKQPSSNKQFLYRKVRQRQSRPTPWIVQKTKDHRYVWRASISIDRMDVMNLLMFILLKRSSSNQCPSILINTGSHGDVLGNVASDTGDFSYTAQFIRDETVNSLSLMILNFGSKLRVNNQNIKTKICINFISTVSPCIYPERADHIIDTQCFGAYKSVKAITLHPHQSLIEQQDLIFLQSLKKSQDLKANKIQQNFYSSQETKEKSIWDSIRDLIITKPMKILVEDSAIIKNQFDAYKLCEFFKFQQKKGFFEIYPKFKKIENVKLLFRASEHHFNITEYFKLYGEEKNTFFICLTEKDKIIGAYSPLSHEYKWSLFDKIGKWAEDPEKKSFVFSVTNNEKFGLKNPSRAIFRMKDKTAVIFGCQDFAICDNANKVKDSATYINYAYFNQNYQQTQTQGQYSPESCLRFNGNDGPQFLVKQWQVWKAQLQYSNFNLMQF